jgi:hypothetical protein
MNSTGTNAQNAKCDQRTALVAGLRELADFYEQHPEVPSPSWPRWTHCISSNEHNGYETVEAYAKALGTTVAENPHREGGVHDINARGRFGAVEVEVYQCTPDAMRRHRERQKVAEAARWVFVCADENVQSAGYETERELLTQLDAHREGCIGGMHEVKLVPAELVGSTR